MPSLRVLSTVLDLPNRVKQRHSSHREPPPTTWPDAPSQDTVADPVRTDQETHPTAAQAHIHDEFKLPKTASLVVIQLASALLQVRDTLIAIGLDIHIYCLMVLSFADIVLHYSVLFGSVCRVLGRICYVFRSRNRHPHRLLWTGVDTAHEAGPRCGNSHAICHKLTIELCRRIQATTALRLRLSVSGEHPL